MPESHSVKNFVKGFSKLPFAKRLARLIQMGVLNAEDIRYLKSGGLKSPDLAEKFIENVIGYFQLPLGVAVNFVIDGQKRVIPMAVEETSIIAAASKTARWVSEHGFIQTSVEGCGVIGQVQIAQVRNFNRLNQVLKENKQNWIQKINKEVIPSMYQRGGGVKNIYLRRLPYNSTEETLTNKEMAVIHVVVDTCDAMGANVVNQVCEYLRGLIEATSKEEVSICIVSNLSDTRLVKAEIIMSGLDPLLMKKIESASIFAETDPYRAATGNKGVMNGIDAVLIATGNDWRAVSAGVHAYCARTGRYQAITKWRVRKNRLHGVFCAPLMVGSVGGIIRLHPTARIGLKLLGAKDAEELARICAAVGLVQNLGALRALTTVGIIEGHMKLHIQNLALSAGAKGWEIPIVQKHLEMILEFKNRIFLSQAVEALRTLRKKTSDHAVALKQIRDKHYQQALSTLRTLKARHKKWMDKVK